MLGICSADSSVTIVSCYVLITYKLSKDKYLKIPFSFPYNISSSVPTDNNK
jgi:hypothetical protein